SFYIDGVAQSGDWSSCGAQGTGQVASARAALATAQQSSSDALAGVNAKRSQITVSLNALAQVTGLRQDDIAFHSATGETINALSFVEGVGNAVEKGLETA